jgi:hypothetical protein
MCHTQLSIIVLNLFIFSDFLANPNLKEVMLKQYSSVNRLALAAHQLQGISLASMPNNFRVYHHGVFLEFSGYSINREARNR